MMFRASVFMVSLPTKVFIDQFTGHHSMQQSTDVFTSSLYDCSGIEFYIVKENITRKFELAMGHIKILSGPLI